LTIPYARQTVRELIFEYVPGGAGYSVFVNNKKVTQDEMQQIVPAGAEVEFVPDFGDIITPLLTWLFPTVFTEAALATAVFGPITWGMVFSTIGYMATGYMINSLMPKPKMPKPHGGGSMAYSWDPKTTQEEGRVIPRTYGTFRPHGNIIGAYTKPSADGRKQEIYALIAFCDGPVASVGDIYLAGKTVENFSGVSTETRRGLIDQTHISFFDKMRIQYRPNKKVTNAGGAVIWQVPDDDIDDMEIDLRFNAWYRHKSGGAGNATISIKLEISERDSGSWTELVSEDVNDSITDIYWKTYTVSDYYVMTRGKLYDLRLTKTSGDYGEGEERAAADLWLENVKEVIDVAFTYPGMVLVGISGMASEDLPGIMDVSALIGKRIVNVFNGTSWSLNESDNPAWALYDVFTQPVISGDGDGTPYVIELYDGFATSRIDADDVFELAEFADGMVPDGRGGTEKRFTFNAIFDTESNMWDTVLRVCEAARCLPNWDGNKMILAISKTKNRAGIYSVGNIVEGSFEEVFAPKIDRAAEIEVEFNDADRNYERRLLPFFNNNLVRYQNVVTLDVPGLVKQTEVIRHIKQRLAQNELLSRTLTIKADIDAMRWHLGDRLGVQHDVPDWNSLGTRGGGRLYGFSAGEADDIVTLDKDLSGYIKEGSTYELAVRLRGSDAPTIKTVKSVSGAAVTIDGKYSGIQPRNGDVWALGLQNQVLKDFTIVAPSRTQEGEYTLILLEYNSAAYDTDDQVPLVQVPGAIAAKSDRYMPTLTLADIRRQAAAAALEGPNIDTPMTTDISFT